jgi:hypothetical protein
MEEREVNEKVLSRVDANRRAFVKRILAGAAFAVPVLATFTIDALAPTSAQAQCLNCTPATPEPSTLLLVGTGAIGLGITAYRKAKRKNDDPKAGTGADESTPGE